MHSLVIWLSPLVARRAFFLFSVVIFAFAGGGRCGVVSSGSGTLDGTLLDSAEDTTHFVVFIPHEQFDIRIARARNWTTFFERAQTPPVSHGTAQGFQEDWIRSPCRSRRKPPCLRRVLPIFTRQDPMARRSVVILMGTH